jgi:hypothetical protein
MKKLLLLGAMLTWGAAANAQTGGAADQCPSALAPAIQQTNVSTVERNADDNSAVIQLDIVASVPDGAPSYAFSSSDGTITSNGSRATWTVTGQGPFTANVEVTAPNGCKSYSDFTYHMEQTASQ